MTDWSDDDDSTNVEPNAPSDSSAGASTGSDMWPLREVTVGGLFDRHSSLTIPLDERATILTGENGSGKSTILQAMHSLASGQWNALAQLPLKEITLIFANGDTLRAATENRVVVRYNDEEPWEVLRDYHEREAYDELRSRLVHRYSLGRASRDETRILEMQLAELEARLAGSRQTPIDKPGWWSTVSANLSTSLISARRLELRLAPNGSPSRERGEPPASVVDRSARELANTMQRDLAEYATESRSQERELPSKIVDAILSVGQEGVEALASSVDELRSNVRTLAESLARVGLLQGEDPAQQFAEYPRNNEYILLAVREVYRVTEQRLQRLMALQNRLELFREFLNKRLTFKRIDLNRQSGVDVVLDGERKIRPSQLSSGEQQLMALAFEVIFRSQPRSVVFIDEPELSLHVAWLQGILSAFLDIGAVRRLQFVIATHSPSVLAGYKELERSLDELTQDELTQ